MCWVAVNCLLYTVALLVRFDCSYFGAARSRTEMLVVTRSSPHPPHRKLELASLFLEL